MSFILKQNDTNPAIEVDLEDSEGIDVPLNNVQEVSFYMRDAFDNLVIDDNTSGEVSIVDKDKGIVEYSWKPEDTEDTGMYDAEFEVIYANGDKETFPNGGYISVEVVEEIHD